VRQNLFSKGSNNSSVNKSKSQTSLVSEQDYISLKEFEKLCMEVKNEHFNGKYKAYTITN
jgi:hypothetical protein